MNTKELLEKIARYKSAMEAETDADTKKKFQSRIDQLEKDIAQVESAVEKQEEKLEKQEDKALEEAEKKLQRYKDAMDAESDPDTKAKFKKRIDDLEKQLKGVKEQIKEEKKEIEEQKKDIKDAVQDVQSAQKTVRTQAIKKAGQQVVARKATTTKKKTRKKAIANIITKLDKLIDKNPALKAKYKGARGGSYMQYPSVDLKRDAGRASKPFGYRFKGDNTKVPRPDQRGQSNVYYENRANRADVYPKRKIKLEDGGMMMADGGENTYANVLMDFGFRETKGAYGTRKFVHVEKRGNGAAAKKYTAYINESEVTIETPEVIRGALGSKLRIANSVPKLLEILRKLGLSEDYVNPVNALAEINKKNGVPGFADGGMTLLKEYDANTKVVTIGEDTWYLTYIDPTHFYLSNSPEFKGNAYHIGEFRGKEPQLLWNDVRSWLKSNSSKMADGGMAGHGRRMATGGVVLNLYTTGADWKMNMAKQKDFDDYKSARKAGDKSGAFEYEIVDEITGDVIYSTHSEKMTPSLAYKDGGMVEYVLYGTKVGKKDWQEEVLAVRPYKFEITPELEKVTKKDGYNRLRIAKIDLSTPPDFRKIVKKSIGGEMDGGKTEDDWEVLQVRPRKKKAKTQGYDDRKDESLGMSRGKTASKDLDGTKKEKEKSRRDDAGFETRKKRGRKKHIYSWKPEAKGKVPISALKKTPSEYYAKKFPNLVNLEKQ